MTLPRNFNGATIFKPSFWGVPVSTEGMHVLKLQTLLNDLGLRSLGRRHSPTMKLNEYAKRIKP